MTSADEDKKFKIKSIIYQFIKENKGIIILYLFLLLAYPIEQVLVPHLYGKVIDTSSKSKPSNIFDNTKILMYSLIGIWMITQSMYIALDYADSYLVPNIQSYIRENIVMNIIKTFKNNYKDLEINDIITKIVKLPHAIRDISHQLRHYFISTNIIVIAMTIYIFYCNKNLGLITLTNVLILIMFTLYTGNKCIAISENKEKYHNNLHEEIGDVLNNLLPIYASNTSQQETLRLQKYQKALDNEYTDGILCSTKFRIIFSIFNIIMFITINGYALYLYSQKKINIGTLVSILIVVLYLLNNLSEMRGELRDLIFNIGVIKETQLYLDELLSKSKSNNINDSSNLDINIHNGEIICKNVNFKYQRTDEYVFENLNLLIKPKQTVAIVGKNGSGKSTLTKLIMKYCQNQSGDIYIDRVNIKNVDTNKLRQKISYMPQNPRLFNRSVLENITYGTQKNKQDVEKIIKDLNLEKLFAKLDNGLDTKAGKNGNNLSGGQRQVVFLLRSLLRDTHIMILDEPTSALDIKNKNIVIDVIKKIIGNKTTLIITHDPDILESVDRIIELHKGKIISDVTQKN